MKILKKKLKISKKHSIKSKRLITGFLSVCVITLSTIFSAFMHEFGHILALMYIGQNSKGIYFDGLNVGVYFECLNK